ncbi:DUF2334 domain-containing protein [Ornithinibacillus bavariensis]|uniref:DUF2334 domain-containing protein n=1 Tax=Ornithinibacillus bavariensis TaxID=545502 RepID=UPI000EDF5640|nr:hypothetical protein [Ornithinibacillus sp.]
MIYKRLGVLCGLFLFLLLVPIDIAAATSVNGLDDRNVLITYYGTNDETLANVYFLDSTLSGLFEHVEIIDLKSVRKADIEKQDIIIYYATKEGANIEKLNLFTDFKGEVLGVGKEAKTLPQFRDWEFLGMKSIHRIGDFELNYPIDLLSVKPSATARVLVQGQQFSKEYPVMIQDGRNSFITISSLFAEGRNVISAAFFDLFQLSKPNTHPAYIRLEDISPMSDPEYVYEAADYLLDRDIPVYLAVIPVYVNPESDEIVTLSDKPKLTKVLKELVDRGAYVISHGYTHMYGNEQETGEGFEFWDSILNQPITTINPKDKPEKIMTEDQFLNKKEYEQYIQGVERVETEYINGKLENSIHSLTRLGLAPTSFEAPHYTMSSNGYQVTSHYFSAIFGQIQASDKDWQVMFSPLFISKPSLLNGMILYPETIGFVDPASANPILDIEKSLNQVLQVPGSVIGGFYHPYLGKEYGLDYLKQMVALIENVPNVEWIELKNEKHVVKTDLVEIVTSGNGEIEVKSELSWLTIIKDKFAEDSLEKYLWIIVIVTAIFVMLFIIHIVTLRMRYRKRLFKETKHG